MPDHSPRHAGTEHQHHYAQDDDSSPHNEHRATEDWGSEEYVGQWLAHQEQHADERRHRFAIIRAVVPKLREQEFRYVNLGAGPGDLDEMLLDHFPGAVATLVDVSLMMLGTARQRLDRFGPRVEYVQANLGAPEWVGAVGEGFDFVISTNAVHHAGDTERICALYAEVYGILGHGGIVLNLDRVRAEDPALAGLAGWAARDPEAGLAPAPADPWPGLAPLSDHLAWLREAGFRSVDILWKDLSSALVFGVRDHFHLPQAAHGAATGEAHAH